MLLARCCSGCSGTASADGILTRLPSATGSKPSARKRAKGFRPLFPSTLANGAADVYRSVYWIAAARTGDRATLSQPISCVSSSKGGK
jgi:hypothetical protein